MLTILKIDFDQLWKSPVIRKIIHSKCNDAKEIAELGRHLCINS